jgi:hypothetical protein
MRCVVVFEPMALRDKPYIEKTRKLYVCIVNNNENFEMFCFVEDSKIISGLEKNTDLEHTSGCQGF